MELWDLRLKYCPPRPELPLVPTAAMPPAAQGHLVDALRSCKSGMTWPAMQEHVNRGYALLWIHLTLERRLDPCKTVAPTCQGHRTILQPFIKAGALIGLHDRAELGRRAPEVAKLAAKLWRETRLAQEQNVLQVPLPYGTSEHSASLAQPGWPTRKGAK
jgi:hypothetical protein